MEKHTKIISTCCYIEQDNKVLFLHRNKTEGLNKKRFYRGLGGKSEQGENPYDCVKREIMEEAGISINPEWKGLLTISKPSGTDWEAHVFTAKGYEGKLFDNSPEGELIWVDKNAIKNLEMPEADRKLLPLIWQESIFHAHAKYDNYKKLIELDIKHINTKSNKSS